MTITSREAAKTICKHGNWNVTNLELQKILYLTHMVYLGQTGESLVNGEFRAWPYGPVEKDIYDEVKFFGAGPISDVFKNADIVSEEKPEGKFLKEACMTLLKKSPSELVALTHKKDGAWKNTDQGAVISNEAIVNEFQAIKS